MNDELIRVGVITSTHGIKGEVKVYPTTDDIHRFDSLENAIIMTKYSKLDVKIEHVKYFKNQVILKFKGIDNINDIEKYKGCDLLINREDAVELEDGEYFISDIIGLSVVTDEGTDFGEVVDVMETGANDVYVIKRRENNEEVLFPAIEECILKVDLDKKQMLVHIMDGLL